MMLEAESAGCLTHRYLLRLDGRPWGDYAARFFREATDVNLMGGDRLAWVKPGMFSRTLMLLDAEGRDVASASRAGMFTSRWDLALSLGPAVMVSNGMFTSGYHVDADGQRVANARARGLLRSGWVVTGDDALTRLDLLLIGLVYGTILNRQRQAAIAAT